MFNCPPYIHHRIKKAGHPQGNSKPAAERLESFSGR